MATTKSKVPEPFYLNQEDGKLMLTVDKIIVGDRHRKAKGKLAALKKSITDVGQLQPIVVDAQCNLIAGWRRLVALTELGMDAEVTIARELDDATAALRAERDENICREPFSAAEALSLANAIKSILKPVAETRQKAGKKQPSATVAKDGPSRNLRTGTKQRTDEAAAAPTGRSAATLRKVEKIKTIAFDQDSPIASKALAEQFWDKCVNDPEVKVDPLYQALMAQLKADEATAARVLEEAGNEQPAEMPAETPEADAGTDTPAPAEDEPKAPPRPRIDTLLKEVTTVLSGQAAVLESIYADERFVKSVGGNAVKKLTDVLHGLVDAHLKATAVITAAPDEVAEALAATAADPRYTVDPTTEPNADES